MSNNINNLPNKRHGLSQNYASNINAGNIECYSKFSGHLTAINIHKGYKLTIHTILGDKINCIFDKELLPIIKPLLGENVHIKGIAKYKAGKNIPHQIRIKDVDGIEHHQEPAQKVTLKDLYGIAPGITKGKGAVVFIREIRDELE
ncbi:MAG: hypothetical protein K0U41_03370 [Gammaproteobacteria bacterium]|nr:hypothetical protein [Gammaproteobacteria bacterium]